MKNIWQSRRFIATSVVFLFLLVIGILVFPTRDGRLISEQKVRAKDDLMRIGLAIDIYKTDVGHYPFSLFELLSNTCGETRWRGSYLTNGIPIDPWGHAYVYRYLAETQTYELLSLGSDGIPSKDDQK